MFKKFIISVLSFIAITHNINAEELPVEPYKEKMVYVGSIRYDEGKTKLNYIDMNSVINYDSNEYYTIHKRYILKTIFNNEDGYDESYATIESDCSGKWKLIDMAFYNKGKLVSMMTEEQNKNYNWNVINPDIGTGPAERLICE